MAHTHKFLSDGWFEAVQELIAEGRPELPDPLKGLVVNVDITDLGVPVTYRGCWFESGHSPDAEATLAVESALAHEVLIRKNLAIGVRALATGKAKLKGNRSKLMKLRSVRPTASQQAFEQQVQEFTEV